MLIAEPENPADPAQRLHASLWNESHSLNAILSGVRVAILADPLDAEPPLDVEVPGGPVLLWWVRDQRGRLAAQHIRTSYERLLELSKRGYAGRVLLARPDAGAIADEALGLLGYRREVLGQVAGYWFEPGSPMPEQQPRYLPTGGIVPRVRGKLAVGDIVLSVVPVDGEWRPQSVEATNTYSFSQEIARGEQWRFVSGFSPVALPWPHVLTLSKASSAPGTEVVSLYGESAARRASPAREYVQFTIVGVDPRSG